MLTLLLNLEYMRLKMLEVFRTPDTIARVIERADRVADYLGLEKQEQGYTYITYTVRALRKKDHYPFYFDISNETFVKGWVR